MAGQKTVLVVDDSPTSRQFLEWVLSSHGYNVLTAFDGVSALDVIKAHGYPDLVLTDLDMPRMDGYRLIETLRCSGYRNPIAVGSSRRFVDLDEDQRKKLEGTAYINDKCNREEIIITIGNLICDHGTVF